LDHNNYVVELMAIKETGQFALGGRL